MNTIDRINALLTKTGGEPITVRVSLHNVLDRIDHQLGITTGSRSCRQPSCICRGGGYLHPELVGERVRRLEHALVQRDVARTFNGSPDYFHLGFEAEQGALAA